MDECRPAHAGAAFDFSTTTDARWAWTTQGLEQKQYKTRPDEGGVEELQDGSRQESTEEGLERTGRQAWIHCA